MITSIKPARTCTDNNRPFVNVIARLFAIRNALFERNSPSSFESLWSIKQVLYWWFFIFIFCCVSCFITKSSVVKLNLTEIHEIGVRIITFLFDDNIESKFAWVNRAEVSNIHTKLKYNKITHQILRPGVSSLDCVLSKSKWTAKFTEQTP